MTEFNDNLDQNIDEITEKSEEISGEKSDNNLNDNSNDLNDEYMDQNSCGSIKRPNEDSNDVLNGDLNEDLNEDNILNNGSNDSKTNKKLKKVIKESEIRKSNKRGIVYLSYIPFGLNVQKIRQILSEFGEIDRIYLEKEKPINESIDKKKKKQKKSYNCRYVEGWVEFKKKSVAKTVAQILNGKQIGGKRKTKFYDQIWSTKYLHKFKWTHLAEQLSYEKALRQQRLRLEIGRAKKETAFYEQMSSKYKYNKSKKCDENNTETNEKRNYKQRLTDETIRQKKAIDNDIDFELLSKIFK